MKATKATLFSSKMCKQHTYKLYDIIATFTTATFDSKSFANATLPLATSKQASELKMSDEFVSFFKYKVSQKSLLVLHSEKGNFFYEAPCFSRQPTGLDSPSVKPLL